MERDGTYDSTFLTTAGKVLERLLQGPNPAKVSDVVRAIPTMPGKTSYTILVVAQHFGLWTIIVPTRKNSNPAYLRGKRVAYVVRHPTASLTSAGLGWCPSLLLIGMVWRERRLGVASAAALIRRTLAGRARRVGMLSPRPLLAVPTLLPCI